MLSAAVHLLYDDGSRRVNTEVKIERTKAQERTGNIRETHLFPLLKFTDRNTCATLSHNTAYDQ